MKAKHRHELKTNELAEWLGNLPQWAKENARTIIIVCVVVVAAVGSYLYFNYQRKATSVREQLRLTELVERVSRSKIDILNARRYRGEDISYLLLRLAEDLGRFAQNAKDDQRAAVALIERASALRTELLYRPGTVGTRDLTSQIERAKASYNQALEKTSSPSLTALAKFGLGLCEEELGNFAQANQMYRNIADDPNLKSTTAAVQAKQRLETMADYRKRVVFRPAPPPRPLLPMQPPVPLRPPEIDSDVTGGGDATSAAAGLGDINAPAERAETLFDINLAAP
ncbi:MAG: tetratricopeptide repeat protein [Planctomycetota bacterium]|jgi:predicted negative regulator of RcsB-dependent stress response